MMDPESLNPKSLNQESAYPVSSQRAIRFRWWSLLFQIVCVGVACLSAAILLLLLVSISIPGLPRLNSTFLTASHDPEDPNRAGLYPALIGSMLLCLVCAVAALPIGIGTAIYLEEFKPRHRWLRRFHSFIQLNIANLAGVPSVVYGLLGLTVFVYMFQLFGKLEQNEISGLDFWGIKRFYQFLSLDERSTILIPLRDEWQLSYRVTGPELAVNGDLQPIQMNVLSATDPVPSDPQLLARSVREGTTGGVLEVYQWYYFRVPFGASLLSAGLTLALVILPMVVISSQEALRAVPGSLREAAAGMGATRWQTVRQITLPAALPGVMTGCILSMGRAIGEAAPLFVVLGGNIGKSSGPEHLMDSCVTLPILIFAWADSPSETYRQLAAAAIIVLVLLLLLMNSLAIYLRLRNQ